MGQAHRIGELSLLDLGDSRCEKVTFEGVVGTAILNFGGGRTSDMTMR